MNESHRNQAIEAISNLPTPEIQELGDVNVNYYGEDVFSPAIMAKYLPRAAAKTLLTTIRDGSPLNATIASDVAHAMKQWALERGATHYTHWFQPMTGATAEKHDSFLEPENMQPIMRFSGKNLIVSEPDASSFPSGGLRSTFEARGYTAWDPTSPAFIKRHGNGATLCIPTAYCSYTGEALDKKTPLLRSRQALSAAVKRLMKCLGQGDDRVEITLGVEQEYFLIDKHFYLNRPDLVQTGRTLFGEPPARHQQLDDHYFGAIRRRILNFMTDVERELWRLGIPSKTRHNEVAPAQFELAPLFEEVNLAVDHNMLIMEVLKHTAERHGLVCLLHEKPFRGVNGSGKHNNWSIRYGSMNLLDPGDNPQRNAIFLAVLTSVIEAVDKHSDLLRCAVASAGNDHRLGANEAPPAIISIFLGSQLHAVIDHIVYGKPLPSSNGKTSLQIGVNALPELPRDTTDRNRTSPFAFTGNKFEFRAPGSSQSCAGPMTTLNTIVAEAMDSLSDELEGLGESGLSAHLDHILRRRLSEHSRIIFNGDNYSKEWIEEAHRRGLPDMPDTMTALHALVTPKNLDLFSRYGVFSPRELESRFEIFMEEYHRRIRIEGQLSHELAQTLVLPVLRDEYARTLRALHDATATQTESGATTLRQRARELGTALDTLSSNLETLATALKQRHEDILEAMQKLRKTVDSIETFVDDRSWPLPKYREMLFIY